MRRASIFCALMAAFAVTAPALAAEQAVPGSDSSNPIPSPGAFYVRSSNGYLVSVFARAEKTGRARVLVSAVGRTGRVSVEAPADLSGEGIAADLGRYGQIDMDWVSSGQAEKGRTRCRSVRSIPIWFAGGAYVGKFDFHGEEDFTAVQAESVDGRQGWWRYEGCGYTVSEGYPGPGVLLEAERSIDGGPRGSYRYFSTVQNSPQGEVSYAAGVGEIRGGIRVYRSAYVTAGAGTLRAHERLDRAELRPPAPFSGRGVFDRIARRGPGTWRGDLRVDFPGRPGVSLAGRRWTGTLVHGFREIHPLRYAPSARGFIPESGVIR